MMQTTPFDTTNTPAPHYDEAVNVEVIIGQSGDTYVVYDRPFNKPLSWFEFDASTGRLEFVMEDGELRNFGVPIRPDIAKHIVFAHTLTFALIADNELMDAQELPLIVHGL